MEEGKEWQTQWVDLKSENESDGHVKQSREIVTRA